MVCTHTLFQAGLFAVDVKNAILFSNELEKSIDLLSVLSDGSSIEINASPLNSWAIFYENEQIQIKVKNEHQEKNIKFFPALSPQISEPGIFSKRKVILEKSGNSVLIKNS